MVFAPIGSPDDSGHRSGTDVRGGQPRRSDRADETDRQPSVSIVARQSPTVSAVAARLGAHAEIHDLDDRCAATEARLTPPRSVVAVWCLDDRYWNHLEAIPGDVVRVAVLSDVELSGYRRALGLGAAAVAGDTSVEIITAAIRAAGRGEALLPLAVASALASDAEGGPDKRVWLTEAERKIGRRLLDGWTVEQIARELHFSDRTLRRRVQAIYVKLGVSTRRDALGRLADLLDQRDSEAPSD